MGLTEKEFAEDQKWLRSVQNKFKRLISSEKWDCIELSILKLDIVTHIMNCKSVKELSPSINDRIVDQLLSSIRDKFSKVKFSNNEREF